MAQILGFLIPSILFAVFSLKNAKAGKSPKTLLIIGTVIYVMATAGTCVSGSSMMIGGFIGLAIMIAAFVVCRAQYPDSF